MFSDRDQQGDYDDGFDSDMGKYKKILGILPLGYANTIYALHFYY
jgi:hypothetical protein